MAKRKQSRKARAASLRNLAKARRKNKRRHKRNPVLVTGKNLRTRRVRGKRRKHKKTARRRPKHTKKRSHGKKRSGHRKSAKRVAAGKKAARTRKRNRHAAHRHVEYTPPSHQLTAETRRRRRRKRKKNPVSATAEAPKRRRGRRHPKKRGLHYTSKRTGRRRTRRMRANDARRGWDRKRGRRMRRNPAVAERRRRRRHHRRRHHAGERRRHHRRSHRRRNPVSNPINGMMEFMSSILGVGAGFGLASFADRLAITHALSATNQDAPAQGQIYNSEALLTPIWMSGKRMAYAAGAITLPLVAAHFIGGAGLKAFFQLMGFGALGRTAGKAFDDGVAALMYSNASVQRLYSGELAAVGKLNAANVAALAPAPPATFAGVRNNTPRQFAGAPTQTAIGAFGELPVAAGSLGGAVEATPPANGMAGVPRAPATNTGNGAPVPPPVFIPALSNPDGQT